MLWGMKRHYYIKDVKKKRTRPLSLSFYPIFPLLKSGIAGERHYYAKQEAKVGLRNSGIRTILYVKVDIEDIYFCSYTDMNCSRADMNCSLIKKNPKREYWHILCIDK